MKYTKYLIVLITTLLLTSTCYSENICKNYFRLPIYVTQEVQLPEEIEVYYRTVISDLNLPGAGLSSNIFYRLNQATDPLEGWNRTIFYINGYLMDYILQPIAWAFSAAVPKYVRIGVRKMDKNINMPNRLINSILQTKFKQAGIVVTRFLVNTTVGIEGFYDPANAWIGLKPHNTNFGETFKYWGIGHGCYLVLPIEGSTSLRDGIGMVGDYFANPITWIPPLMVFNPISLAIKTVLGINSMTLNLPAFKKVYKANYDAYDLTKQIWFFMDKQQPTSADLEDLVQ